MVDGLAEHGGLAVYENRVDLDVVRRRLYRTAARNGGEFICHQTVYTSDFSMKDHSCHRQCRGAAEYYKNGEDL